jgi:hypothetical protein
MNTVKPLDCKAGSSGIERPLFKPGLLLEDEDLTAGVSYTRELSRLLFRSLFGCGVICGLEVKSVLFCKRKQLRVTVGPGLALDGAGNPMHVTKSVQLETGRDCDPVPATVWVVICYKELPCRLRDLACSPDAESQSVKTRAVDAYEIKLYKDPPECACSCGKKTPTSTQTLPGNCCEELIEPATVIDPTPPAGGASTEPDPCDCYSKHYQAGTCVDCGCSCVLLATIDTTKDNNDTIDLNLTGDIETKVDTSGRRWIRPVLTGMCKCRAAKTRTSNTAPPVANG